MLFGDFQGQRRTLLAGDGGGIGAGKDGFCAFRTGFLGRDRSYPPYSASFLAQRCVPWKDEIMSFLHPFFMDFDLIVDAFW